VTGCLSRLTAMFLWILLTTFLLTRHVNAKIQWPFSNNVELAEFGLILDAKIESPGKDKVQVNSKVGTMNSAQPIQLRLSQSTIRNCFGVPSTNNLDGGTFDTK
jgi:hypothetical protein